MATQSLAPIDYTSKDYTGFVASMLDYATRVFPSWTNRTAPDFGVMLVELFAYMGDILSYYQDRIANEAYLSTATQRSSVLAIANMLGYTPAQPTAASGTVTLTSDASTLAPVVVPAGTQLLTAYIPECHGPLLFETTADASVPAGGGSTTIAIGEGATQGDRTLSVNTVDDTGASVATSVRVQTLALSSGHAGQAFAVALSPVLLDSLRVFVEYPLGAQEWKQVDTLLSATDTDYVYVVGVDAAGQVAIAFGDGVSGVIPPTGLVISIAYKSGGGARGNVAANALLALSSPIPGISIASSSAMSGGTDAEEIDSIRTNAPLAYSTADRAVSLEDFANLALRIPGVAKANVVALSYTSVTLYIAGPNNAAPSQALIDEVSAYVQARALAGVSVSVNPPVLVPVNIGSPAIPVTVVVHPKHRRDECLLLCRQICQFFLGAVGTIFGQVLSCSKLYSALHEVPGVVSCNVPLFCRADGVQAGTSDVICRDWEIPVQGDIAITATGGI